MRILLLLLLAAGCYEDDNPGCECQPDLASGYCSKHSDCRTGMYCVAPFGGCHEPGYDGGQGPCSEIFVNSCQPSLFFDPALDCQLKGDLVECTCKYGHC